MKVLLTGATGFLGSHILKSFIEQDCEVIVIKRSFSNEDRIINYQTKYKSYNIDEISLYEIFERESVIDFVIHCATNYGRGDDKIYDVFQSNVAFPLELLEIATHFNTDTFINTDTFFGKRNIVKGYMENYILTKNQFIEWGKLFAESEKINFINMRLEHIYGEGDNNSKFIPFVVSSCINNVEKIDLTDGEHLRDFVYVDDVIKAYFAVVSFNKRLRGYHEYEVGSGNAVKVCDFVSEVKSLTKSKTKLNFGAIAHRENEILYSVANISKLKGLGWVPKYDFAKGIEKYIDRLIENSKH